MTEKSLNTSFEETRSQFAQVTENPDNNPKSCSFGVLTKDKIFDNHYKPNRKIKKVKNFQKQYLDLGFWPDTVTSDVRSKYYSSRKKINELRSQISKENQCKACENYIFKYNKSSQALMQALELSAILIKKIAELES
jgi:hypothetical protein